MVKTPKKKYASVKNPTIQAIVQGNFRFSSDEQAQKRLEVLRDTFVVSRLPEGVDPAPDKLKLWIRGYQLSSEMREEGYKGNYARLEVVALGKGQWSIQAVALNIEKKYHPQRAPTRQRHPNWGHPILRDVKKKRVHTLVENAQNELQRLHEQFPDVSIPLTNKMYIMIYQKPVGDESPVKKWVLEIQATEDGTGFFIDHYENTFRREDNPATKVESTQESAQEPTAPPAPVGKFTSQVLLKKSRKNMIPKVPPTTTEGDSGQS
jgi:hypothetical protein